MSTQGTIRTLNRLHRLCKAGERGFNAVSENVENRGLKVLMRMYAEQRRQFALELKREIERLGGHAAERRSIPGIIHRGRIDIMATLTIEPEKSELVALREASIGENTALRAYETAVRESLPAETKELLQRQYEAVQAASNEVQRLRGNQSERLIVRLFDTEQSVNLVARELEQAGFDVDDIDTVAIVADENLYMGEGSTLDETIASGAVGGGIWVGILGAISGAMTVLTPGLGPIGAMPAFTTWALITIGGVLVGALFGAILGLLIGMGIHEEDAYILSTSVREGSQLVKVNSSRKQASQARQILQQTEMRYRNGQNNLAGASPAQ